MASLAALKAELRQLEREEEEFCERNGVDPISPEELDDEEALMTELQEKISEMDMQRSQLEYITAIRALSNFPGLEVLLVFHNDQAEELSNALISTENDGVIVSGYVKSIRQPILKVFPNPFPIRVGLLGYAKMGEKRKFLSVPLSDTDHILKKPLPVAPAVSPDSVSDLSATLHEAITKRIGWTDAAKKLIVFLPSWSGSIAKTGSNDLLTAVRACNDARIHIHLLVPGRENPAVQTLSTIRQPNLTITSKAAEDVDVIDVIVKACLAQVRSVMNAAQK